MTSDRKVQLREVDLDPDPVAQCHIAKVQAEHDEQYLALRRRAQGMFAALKGRTGVRSHEDFDKLLEKTRDDFDSGVFLVERLGASRFLDPDLTCVLIRIRDDLLSEIERPTAADRMHVDAAVLAYRNLLRIQNLINNSLMETERQLFGQTSLEEVLGQTEAKEVECILEDVEQKLVPLLERCQRMMNRALDRLGPRNGANRPRISIGAAGQVNIVGDGST